MLSSQKAVHRVKRCCLGQTVKRCFATSKSSKDARYLLLCSANTTILTSWRSRVRDNKDRDTIERTVSFEEENRRLIHAPPQAGLYFKDKDRDIEKMITEKSAHDLAASLRAYDHILQKLAHFHNENHLDQLNEILFPYTKEELEKTRCDKTAKILDKGERIEDCRFVGVAKVAAREDIQWLMQNFTSIALAEAIRIRSERIQYCAELYKKGEFDQVACVLKPFQVACILKKRGKDHRVDWSKRLLDEHITLMRKVLTAVPRRVGLAHQQRAAVVIPVCEVNGVPSLLFQVRSKNISGAGEVCFPGGKLDMNTDTSTMYTAIRELREEIPGLPCPIVVAGLRCPWEQVQSFYSDKYAVTPIVGWLGEIGLLLLRPNPRESQQVFTIPIVDLLNDENWIRDRDLKAPIFIGGPHVIFGLTGYILDKFVETVVDPLKKR